MQISGERRPGDRERFASSILNIWLDHSSDPFVDMNVCDEGNFPVDFEALKGQPYWLAADLILNGGRQPLWRRGATQAEE